MIWEIAIGDAYGAGFEFSSREKILQHNTLVRYVSHDLGIAAGHYTDDTQMTIAVAEVLLGDSAFSVEVFADAFVRCYKRDPRPGYALKFRDLLDQCADGATLRRLIHPKSHRNGAAMRSVPLGLIPDLASLRSAAHAQASITHNTIEGVLSSEIVALMAHALLYEQSTLKNLPLRIERATGFVLSTAWSRDVECDAIQTLHAVATALLRNCRISELLVDCVNFGGDVDSVAAIALGLASLSNEYENDIPAKLSIDLESGPYGQGFLRNLDEALAERFPALRLLAQ